MAFRGMIEEELAKVQSRLELDLDVAVTRQLKSTYANAQVWITGFKKYADGAACKNLALALGKISGVISTAEALGVQIPPELEHIREECHALWMELADVYLEWRVL